MEKLVQIFTPEQHRIVLQLGCIVVAEKLAPEIADGAYEEKLEELREAVDNTT